MHTNSTASCRVIVRAVLATCLAIFSQSGSAAEDFFSQIQALQQQAGFEITGMEKIENGEKRLLTGKIDQQIKQLFYGYNHIVSRDRNGKIERIVIIAKKQPVNDRRIQVPIRIQDNQSTVSVALSGDGRNWQSLEMIIDTGADLVVLPESMIEQLGLDASQLTANSMQTANGVVKVKIGTLREVKIAGETIENVETAFIADQQLGNNRLLGMSVIRLFQLSIDDRDHLITLIRK